MQAEYRSSAITQALTLWLTRVGASPDLIRAGLVIAEDELAHAELSHAVLAAAQGSLPGPMDRSALGLDRDPGVPLELDVLRHGLQIFALGETVAVRLFGRLREGATVPEVRAAFDRILRDEVRHRDFGWALLRWLAAALQPGVFGAAIAELLPTFAVGLAQSYADSDVTEVSLEERAWGLMSGAEYAAALAETVRRDYIPRFAELGVETDEADWAACLRARS